MTDELKNAVARLTEWTTPPAPPGVPQHDARLLLADWERIRERDAKVREILQDAIDLYGEDGFSMSVGGPQGPRVLRVALALLKEES